MITSYRFESVIMDEIRDFCVENLLKNKVSREKPVWGILLILAL